MKAFDEGPPEVSHDPEIPALTEVLSDGLDCLQEMFNKLAARLAPVLGPVPQEPSNTTERSFDSELGGRLVKCIARVDQIGEALDDILNGLEV